MGFAFEYDPRKAAGNLKKNGISFSEAMTVFDDPLAQTFPVDLHSEDEARFITYSTLPYFPDSESVNDALHSLKQIADRTRRA